MNMSRTNRLAGLMALLLVTTAAVCAQGVQYQLRVDGMACEFCVARLKNQLERRIGAEGVEIDLDTGRVVITTPADPVLTEEDLREVIDDAGFVLMAFERSWSSSTGVEMPRSRPWPLRHADLRQFVDAMRGDYGPRPLPGSPARHFPIRGRNILEFWPSS